MPVAANASACRFDRALLRAPPQSVAAGLRAFDRGAPELERVEAEHAAYAAALVAAGLSIEILPPLDAYPDSLFVEDPALVFAGGAIVLRPGAPTRVGEAKLLATDLSSRFDRVIDLPGEGFCDGGDVLTLGEEVLIGLSARTTREGAHALQTALARFGLPSRVVATPPGVLHFKSDCAPLGDHAVLTTRRLAASGCFAGYDVLLTPEGEEAAANALRINDLVLVGASFPRTIAMLTAEGYDVRPLSVDEIGKVDAGLSCMSLRWRAV
jgi:dimethylargininase